MNDISGATLHRLRDGLITLDDVAAIVGRDVHRMSEADLAAVLCSVMADGPHPIARVVEPIIRAELARRQASRILNPLLLTSI